MSNGIPGGLSALVPGHSSVPKALYWWRKAAALPNAGPHVIKEINTLESIVKGYCANCKMMADELPDKLKACSLCKAAYYWGKECQRIHWKAGHKVDCIKGSYPGARSTNRL